jgi:hypothetical protein
VANFVYKTGVQLIVSKYDVAQERKLMHFKKNDMQMKTSSCYVYRSNNPTKKLPHNREHATK